MSKQGKEHARGPYKHGKRYRVVYVAANGAEHTLSYEDVAQAEAARDAFNQAAGSRTVGEAMGEYLRAHAGKPGLQTIKYRLYGLLRVTEVVANTEQGPVAWGDKPLSAISEKMAQKLYTRRQGEVAVDTHQGELCYTKRFFGWCIEQGWLRENPFAEVKAEGEKRRGKPKLRVNGTRQYLAVLLDDDSMEATAVLMALTLKLRASAVVQRTVEDLDDNGWILWVRDSKTAASDLEIEVPAFLRERLLKLVAGKGQSERIFGEMTRHALHYHTVKFCQKAGVPRVTPHGLRGSGATQAVRSGEAIEKVAIEIGHADRGVTLKGHYLGGGAIESGHARRIETLVRDAQDSRTNESNPEVN